ncbi:hypothetical protein ACGFMM_31770 [Streptomyces sp. NPDC048604]|uniref:hypothetical protein n=1 Tax=Streptomyces sp. NPDC048604 TaxID=3365578 RepID=UPI0037161C23
MAALLRKPPSDDIARALRDELGLAHAPPAVPLPAKGSGVPADSLLPPRADFGGADAPTHGYVYVDAPAPRPFELRVAINGVADPGEPVAAVAPVLDAETLGDLVYAVPLLAPVAARLALGAPEGSGRAGRSVFEGDATVAARLNGDPSLLDRANALTAVQECAQRLLTVEPMPHGAVLLVRTRRQTVLRGWSLGSEHVLDLAERIETALY